MPGPGGRTVGRANIRVAPDTSDFGKDLKEKLDRLERSLKANVPAELDMSRLQRQAATAKTTIERGLSGVTADVGVDTNSADVGAAESVLDRLARARTATLNVDIDRAALAGAQRAVSSLTQAAGSFGRFTASASAISLMGSSAAVAAGQITQLAVALAPAAGALAAVPALAAAGGAALGTVRVAAIGLDEAFSALGEGNLEAFQVALQNLPPAARAVLTEVKALGPAFTELRMSVQEELFGPLVGQVEALGQRALPVMGEGMRTVASAMGDAAARVVDFLGTSQSLTFMSRVFDATAEAIRNANGALPNFLSGITAIGTVGLPYVAQMGSAIDALSERFAQWAVRGVQSGQFDAWIQNAIDLFSQLGDIISNVGGIFGSVFQAAGDGGILTTIEQLTGALNDFFNTAEGAQALENIFSALGDIGSALAPVIVAIASGVGTLAPAIGRIAQALGPVLTSAIEGLVPVLAALEPGIMAIVEALGQGINTLVESGALETLAEALSLVVAAVAPLIPALAELLVAVLVPLAEHMVENAPLLEELFLALADTLVQLAPVLTQILTAMLEGLVPVLPELSAAFIKLLEAIVPLIPPLVEALMPILLLLPDILLVIATQIQGWTEAIIILTPVLKFLIGVLGAVINVVATVISWVLGAVSAFFSFLGSARETADDVGTAIRNMRNRVIRYVSSMVSGVVGFFVNLYHTVAGWISAVYRYVVGGFQNARDGALSMARGLVNGISNAINRAVRFVRSLPDRIRNFFGSARRWLKNAGLKIIYGLMDGINDAVRHLWDQMSNIAQGVRNYWPFSPAKTGPLRSHPMDKAGRNLATMLADGMAEGERLVERASNRLAATAVSPSLSQEVNSSGVLDATLRQADAFSGLSSAIEALAGRPVVLQVDNQEIARANDRGQRELARR